MFGVWVLVFVDCCAFFVPCSLLFWRIVFVVGWLLLVVRCLLYVMCVCVDVRRFLVRCWWFGVCCCLCRV